MKDKSEKAQNLKKELGLNPMTILTCVLVVLIFLVIFIPFMIIKNNTKSMYDNFSDEYTLSREKAKNGISNYLYKLIEEANESHGSVSIELGEINEESNLQVLRVGHDAYVIENKEDNPKNITQWQVYTGYGIYKVDLSVAEYIVDNLNRTVTITVPEPEFTWTFVYDTSEEKEIVIFKKDDPDIKFFDNTGHITGDIQKRLEDKAKYEMESYFLNNIENDNKAKEATQISLERMIKLLNPDINDIKVVVNYY